LLWTGIVAIIMMFAGLTSAYIVRQAEGNWVHFSLPNLFYVTTLIILGSSATMMWAVKSAKADQLDRLSKALLSTTILGIGFVIGQYYAWQELFSGGIYLNGNPSGSFLYIITGLHAAHVLLGLFFLLIVLGMSYKKKLEAKKIFYVELLTTYWHFMGGLWIYLFLFLLFNHLN